MDISPQMDAPEKERAERNHQEILQLLQVKQREREFLEIGRLLDECEERQYFRAFGCRSLKEYVESVLKTDYPAATRDKRIYGLSKRPGGPSRNTLRKIGKGKMCLLLRRAEKDQVTPELWKMAESDDYTFDKLRRGLKRYRPPGRPVSMKIGEGSRHKDIQEKIKEIGESLGKYATTEYPSYPSKEFKYDVVWKAFEPAVGVTHVFEVCWESPYKGDIPKLSYAYKNMGRPRLFLVLAKQEDKDKAKSLVSRGLTDEMSQNLTMLTVQEVEQLYGLLFQEESLVRYFIDLFMK
jgi:hypothetical protein